MQPSHTIYLDQCVVSELRTGQPASNFLRTALSRIKGCAFVYSDIHVREILRSGSPLPYIEALEEIGSYHLPMADMVEELSARYAAVTANVIRERIPEQIDDVVAAQLAMEQLLRLSATLDSAGKSMSLENEVEAAIAYLDAYLGDVERKVRYFAPPGFDLEPMLLQLRQKQVSMAAEMRSLEAQKLQQEAHEFHRDFSRQLSKERMDDIPDQEIAAFLINKLPESDTIRTSWPEGFGRGSLSCGQVTGFAFMLFSIGVGRFRRPMKGGSERFVQRLTNQLRDCEHIEQAIRCHAFMTLDDGAARLARAVYGYAGVPNEVILLRKDNQN